MITPAVMIFTGHSVADLLMKGGTGDWVLDKNKVTQCEYAVCCYNPNALWSSKEPALEHGEAFLIGRIDRISPASDFSPRWIIKFSSYALINIKNVWRGSRNPVNYSTMEELGIRPMDLEWQPMPKTNDNKDKESVIIAAKRIVAAQHRVDISKVEIIIRLD